MEKRKKGNILDFKLILTCKLELFLSRILVTSSIRKLGEPNGKSSILAWFSDVTNIKWYPMKVHNIFSILSRGILTSNFKKNLI